jgi:hypothetical protein
LEEVGFWCMKKGGKRRGGREQQKTCILKANPNLNPVPKH